MRRKSDMFKDFTDSERASFLPGEGEQAASTAAQQMLERLAVVEDQLKSQFTSIAAYAQISQQAVETARAESRADLDREKATIVSLLERLRQETSSQAPRVAPEAGSHTASELAPTSRFDEGALARIAMLEDQFDRLSSQFAQVLKSQEDLANSLAFMFEQQMKASGWVSENDEAQVSG